MRPMVRDQPCPECNQTFLVPLGQGPAPGTIVICHACAQILLVGQGRLVRRLLLVELVALTRSDAWADIMQIRRFIRQRASDEVAAYRIFNLGSAGECAD